MSLIDDITTASFWRARRAWRKLKYIEIYVSWGEALDPRLGRHELGWAWVTVLCSWASLHPGAWWVPEDCQGNLPKAWRCWVACDRRPLPGASISHITPRRQSLLRDLGFPRALYAVQLEQSYCFVSHARIRVLFHKIFSNVKTTYFHEKLKSRRF